MVSIKTLKLLLTIKLRNYYRFHVLPLTSFRKSKNTTKQTQRRKKGKKECLIGFHQKKQKNKWATKKLQQAEPVWLATDWVVSTAPLSVLDLTQPLWKMEWGQEHLNNWIFEWGEEYLFLKIAVYGKILRTKGKFKRQRKSWWVCQKGLKIQK